MSPTPRPSHAHAPFTSPRLAGTGAGSALPGSEISIEQVEARRLGLPAETGTCRVAAVVRLGRLTPADVRVCLMPVTAGLDDDSTMADADRLWSTACYDTGVYRFEADVPIARLQRAERMKVHVALSERPDATVRMPTRGCWHLVPADQLRCGSS